MKLWSGRFGKETDALVNDFNASISFDQRLYQEDIAGSIAHAQMLGRVRHSLRADADAIVEGSGASWRTSRRGR
jgi:argininosuccinate lyase